MANELRITNYDLDNVSFHVLKKRLPCFSQDALLSWWSSPSTYNTTVDYVYQRLHCSLDILDTLNLIPRDMNMAKVYGIDYESVMTRGSQFRVEAILSKIAKSTDHLLLSASQKQVAN